MAAAGSSCLSDLSDDLLRRILFFAPAREAAATAVLSRRWRPLCRTSGAVNIDSRSYDHLYPETQEEASRRRRGERSFSWPKREAFFRGAKAALATAEGRVKRLTFTVTEESKIHLTHRPLTVTKKTRIHRAHHESLMEHDLLHAVLSNPAARRVEELRVNIDGLNLRCPLRFGSLPREALQVLDVAGCSPLTAPPPGAAAFPRLASLRLHGCSVSIIDLQRIVDAAPKLATLHLESLYLRHHEETMDELPPTVVDIALFQIRCRAVTALVFADCSYETRYYYGGKVGVGVELDAPMLQYFKYKGAVDLLHHLSLKPQASSSMIRVDVHISVDSRRYIPAGDRTIPAEQRFWRFFQYFHATKFVKLKLDFCMDTIAVVDKSVLDELLGCKFFHKVELLELEAQYEPAGETSMVTLANLLHCCPMVRDLRLKLIKGRGSWSASSTKSKESQKDFDKSVSEFRRRKRPMVSPRGDDDDGGNYEGFGIPALREQSFCCLQSHLRRVSFHFRMEDSNCLGVQLAKFFAEDAMVLEEMFIDDGNQRMSEHINPSFRKWIANSEKRRESTSVVVLPIET